MKFKLEISHGDLIPHGYGMSYKYYHKNVAVCFPIPFNWIVKYARDCYYFLMHGPKSRLDTIYSLGVDHGRQLRDEYEYKRGIQDGQALALQVIRETNQYYHNLKVEEANLQIKPLIIKKDNPFT